MQTQPANLRTAEGASETRPAYLYRLTHGGTDYFLTNYDRDIVTTGSVAETWTSTQIGHEMNEGNADLSSRQATVGLAILNPEFRRYFLTAPTAKATVKIYRLNSGSLPGPLDFAANAFNEFSGTALGPSFSDATISIQFASEFAQEDRTILRFNYQPQCNHLIYGHGCFVNREIHKVETTINAVNRSNRYVDVLVTEAPNADGTGMVAVDTRTFEGGYLKETDTGNLVGIVTCSIPVAGTLRLFLQWWPVTFTTGLDVELFKGCKRTVAGCRDDFDNLDGILFTTTGITGSGGHVYCGFPEEWIRYAARTDRFKPLYNGVLVPYSADDDDDTWRVNVPVDFGGPSPVNLGPSIIVFLHRVLVPGDEVEFPRVGGFAGHPYVQLSNPATDGF